MKDEALCRYFINSPDWERQLKQLRKKSLAGYSDGVIQLKDASDAECQAAEALLGRRFVPPHLRYKLSDFEKALRASRFAVTDMADFWLRLDGRPLLSNPLQKAVRQDAVQAFFAAEDAQPHQPVTRNWLCAMAQDKSNGFQLLAPHIETDKDAARWLHWVCCALDRLATTSEPEELALCSYAVSTDPHALDGQNPAGHLLLHVLAYWKGWPVPSLSQDRLALYRECGLMLDDISCFTVQRGLILALPDGREHPACAQLRQQEQFCLLTSSQISALGAAFSPTGRLCALAEDKSHGFQLVARHIETDKDASRWLHWVCWALDRLATASEPEELALCSYAVSTDPHALDGQNPAGHLLLHALAYWKGRPVPSLSRGRLALYRECGLMLDDISCFTIQRGLILALPDGREHPACAQLRQQEQFCLLTSSQISALGAAFSPTGRVYLLPWQRTRAMAFSWLHATLKLIRTRRAGCTGSAGHWIDWQRPLSRKSWHCAAMRFPPIPMRWMDRTPPGICCCMRWLTGKADLFPHFPGAGWHCTGNVA